MILIVRAQFTTDITKALLDGALSVFTKKNIPYKVLEVPGAVELPVTVQKGIESFHPTAVIALGCVIRGETDHYTYVLTSVTDGLTRVALDFGVPVIQGVIAAPHRKTAENRMHLGAEWAETAITMTTLFHELG